jgi:tRNA modification GTPase
VSGQTALEGFPVTFFDTAGFRTTDDELELQGIDRSLGSMGDADLVIWVIDPTVEEAKRPPCPVEGKGGEERNVLICCNKIDLVGGTADGRRQTAADLADAPAIPASALSGEGIERLLGEVIRRLVPSPPKPLDAVVLTPIPLC